jgi:triosephosphate isomerase
MAERKPVIAGNWKMYKTGSEAKSFITELKGKIAGVQGVEVVVAPPFTALAQAAEATRGSAISLSAQNLHWEDQGAFTGEIAPPMLKEIGCSHVIIGHSERRQFFGESDESVNRKTRAARKHGLVPIMCIGETLAEREGGKIQEVIERQVRKGLDGLGADANLIFAYEPVWAIGTGKTASPEQAEEVHLIIRDLLKQMLGPDFSSRTRILYGGSVKADNIKSLMAKPNIDGALVGGAALKVDSFAGIIRFKE